MALKYVSPFLDHELIEWSCKLPAEYLISGFQGKYLLKKAMEPRLPSDILYRPKKGFNVPITIWFRGPLSGYLRDKLLSGRFSESGIFNTNSVKKLIDDHVKGIKDNHRVLWALLMFAEFMEKA